MSTPQTIKAYLADFNAALEVGVRSRRQIFLEVSDHLGERIGRELREGASLAEAERRAVTAFGPPEEVARSFQAGLLGGLDRRLALGARRLSGWMAVHRWGGVAVQLALLALLALIMGAVAAVGDLVGARSPLGALAAWSSGMTWMLWLGPRAPLRGRLRARLGGLSKRPGSPVLTVAYLAMCPFPMVFWWLSTVGIDPGFGVLMLLVLLFTAVQQGVAWVTDRVLDLGARRSATAVQSADRSSWSAGHPWRAVFFEIWSPTLALLALVLAYPAPLALRAAFAVMVAAATLLVAVGLCLARSLREKACYARSIEEHA